MSTAPNLMFVAEQSSEQFEPETPFLDTRFAAETWLEREQPEMPAEQRWAPQAETPFLTEFHGEAPVNLQAQAVEQTLMELFDRDFNETVANLAMEATAQAEQFAQGGGAGNVQQMLEEWLDPLRRATEQLFEQAGEAAAQQQLEAFSETEFNSFFEGFAPAAGHGLRRSSRSSSRKLWNKVKSVARTCRESRQEGRRGCLPSSCRSARCSRSSQRSCDRCSTG